MQVRIQDENGNWKDAEIVVLGGATLSDGSGAGLVEIGASGTFKSITLNALTNPTDIAANTISDATGYMKFRVRAKDPSLATGGVIAVSWSTNVSDFTNLDGKNDALITAIETPDGASHTDTYTLTPYDVMPWISAGNPDELIKSVLVTSVSGIEMVVVDVLS